MLNYVIILLISIATSTISAMVGLGGGLLLIPFIILFFGLPFKMAAGAMLVAMVPYTAIASIKNFKNGYISFKVGLLMETGSVVGVVLGANFTHLVPDFVLKTIFVSLVLYLMLTLQIPKDSPYNYVARFFNLLNFIPPKLKILPENSGKTSLVALFIVGSIAGFFSGMLGIGGGFLKTPVLIVGLGLAPKIAVGTALFMIMITAFFGASTHIYLGDVNFKLAIAITIGMMIGAYIGSSILKTQPDKRVKRYIFITMFVAGILTLFK